MSVEEAPDGADKLFNTLVAGAEQAKRRYASDGALPGEAHAVVLTRGSYAALTCPNCRRINRLSQPIKPGFVASISCVACGDRLNVRVSA